VSDDLYPCPLRARSHGELTGNHGSDGQDSLTVHGNGFTFHTA
jgi:hypothetical protein